MKLSPKVQANIAGIAVLMPFWLLDLMYPKYVSFHVHIYIVILSALAAGLTCYWVYHRLVATLPAVPGPVPELSLATERLPRMVWLAAVPPVLVAVLVWWVNTHASELPWRHSMTMPLANFPDYRLMAGMLIVFNGLAVWMVLLALAVWHGMSRAYQFRIAQLRTAVFNQWVALLLTLTGAFGTAFKLQEVAAIPLLIVELGCGVVLAWNAGQLKRLYGANPRTGTWVYRDSEDPAFFGPRGVNIANPWFWILVAACIPPIVVAELVLRHH